MELSSDQVLGHGMPCLYEPSTCSRLAVSCLGGMGELAEEAKIVAGERAYIVDAGTHHRQTLDAEPEGKTAVDVRVVADRTQDIGMDHAGATHLQPAGALANPAAGSATDGAVDREVDPRLDERKEVAPETGAPLGTEELPRHLGKGSLEVCHGDVAVDGQSLELMQHPLVRGVLRLVAIDATGNDHSYRRLGLLHHASPHRRRVCTQHDLAGEIDVKR